MELNLKRINIQNFKGITDLTLIFDGNMNIYGDNATGKTTILDAFLWCLFDKNSNNESKFSVKPLNEEGEEAHRLEHIVELVFEIDGREKSFKKIYKEKWTKQRGSTEHEFSGNTTDYYINDTPKSMGEYKKEIAFLADEEIFKMITNLYYFNSMDWKKRRDIVLKLAGDISDYTVIASNPILKPLLAELSIKSIDDVLATAKSTKTRTNKAIEAIPIKVAERQKSFNTEQLGHTNLAELKILLQNATGSHAEFVARKAQGDNMSEILKLENEILKLKNEITSLSTHVSDKKIKLEEISLSGKSLKIELQKIQADIGFTANQIYRCEKQIIDNEEAIIALNERKEKLYFRYDEEDSKIFSPSNCDYCGQALPQNKLVELEKQFNLFKAKTLEGIVFEGKTINEEITFNKSVIESEQKKIQELTVKKEELLKGAADLDKQIVARREEWQKVSNEPESNPNLAEIEKLEDKISSLQKQKNDLVLGNHNLAIEEKIRYFQDEMSRLSALIAQFELSEQNEKRIQELIYEEKQLSIAYEQADKLQSLCEDFIIAKANLLEEQVNYQFDIVNFKLFDKQINGGISETCIATVNGVPYSDLNHAMQVNAGLDIIQALQKVYGIKAPIFIDNAESVTKLKPIDTQIIRLVVSEGDKKLRFENSL